MGKGGKTRELNRLCKANFDLKRLREKMVLWFINKLKCMKHFMIVILKAFPFILVRALK